MVLSMKYRRLPSPEVFMLPPECRSGFAMMKSNTTSMASCAAMARAAYGMGWPWVNQSAIC